MIISIFSSCDGDKTPLYDESALSYIIFSPDTSRDLKIDYDPASYSSLHWFYKAEKADGYGTAGETDAWTPILTTLTDGLNPVTGIEGYIGPFSQGEWNFYLKAYKTASERGASSDLSYTYSYTTNTVTETKTFYFTTPIYESSAVSETLVDELKTVAVAVDTVEGVGKLTLSGLYFTSSNTFSSASMTLTRQDTEAESSSTYDLTISSEEGKYSIAFKDTTSLDITSGTYKCVISASGDDSSSFKSTFYFSIYTGTTTTLSGELIGDK